MLVEECREMKLSFQLLCHVFISQMKIETDPGIFLEDVWENLELFNDFLCF